VRALAVARLAAGLAGGGRTMLGEAELL
jgi:hypothetical protein